MSEIATPAAPQKRLFFMAGNPDKPNGRVSFILNNHPRSYLLASAQGQKLVALLRQSPQDLDAIAEIADVPMWIAKRSHGRVTVDECERLRLDGALINYGLTGRINKVLDQGADFEAIANYIERAAKNPNQDAAERTYAFLEKGDMSLNPEGMIVLFKRVDEDYRSFWSGNEPVHVRHPDGREEVVSGRIPHPVGGEIWMERELCDPSSVTACSVGIHGCSFEYLRKYHGGSGRILIGLVDPADVTAIPQDAHAADMKLRTCRMQIVGEIAEEEAREHFQSVVDQRYPAIKPEQLEDERAADDLTEQLLDEDDRLDAEDELLLTDRVDPDALSGVGQSLPDDAPLLTPADWSKQGYKDGFDAGVEDRRNGYDYDPDMTVPREIEEDDHATARAAYAKSFIEAYDVGFRDVAHEPDVED